MNSMFLLLVLLEMHFSHQQFITDTDCLREADKGVTYNGTVSSIDENLGPKCVKWTDVTSNSAGYREDHKFCRNPDNRDKPWCYTSLTGDWKYCNIPSCALIKCKTYPEIENIIRPTDSPEEYTYLQTINITCQHGYYLNGTAGIQCEKMGNWNTPYPLCIGQSCQEFPNIQNTNPLNKTVGYRHPDNVTVTCQTGYDMNGSSVVMCNAGNWSVLPSCLGLPCPEFPNIQNIKQLNKTIGYRHPDTVTVTCQTGYEMNGSSVVQCYAGMWRTLPMCLGIRILTIEKNELFIAGISTLSIGVVAMIVAVGFYIAFLYRTRNTKKSTENYIDLQTSNHSITDPYSTLDHTE